MGCIIGINYQTKRSSKMENNELVNSLNAAVANVQVLYVKLHNYHWNVRGINFKPVHEMTEAYYDYFAKQYDDLAERILQLGSKPYSSMKDYLANAEITEDFGNDFDGKAVFSSVLADFEKLNTHFKSISKLAAENSDVPTASIADGNVAWLEKQIWMLKASLA
jgi:starvation-inducible DNA-binding protein